jgi:hypothetical protein
MEIEKLRHLDDLRDVSKGDLRVRIPMALVEVAEITSSETSFQWEYTDHAISGAIPLKEGKFLVYAYGLTTAMAIPSLVYATHLREDTNLPEKLFLTRVMDLKDYRTINPRKPLRPV